MTVIATALRHLMAAGVTGEALLAAVEEIEAELAITISDFAGADSNASNALRDDPRREEKLALNAERQRRFRESRRANDNALRNAVTRDSVTQPSLSLPPNDNNSNPPTHTHPDMTTRAREADPFPKPDWADPQHWRDLKANRKAKRLPNTATAHAKLLRDIDKLADDEWPPGRLLEAIVARGWAAAYDPRENRNHGNLNLRTSGQQSPDRRNSLTKACDDALDFLG